MAGKSGIEYHIEAIRSIAKSGDTYPEDALTTLENLKITTPNKKDRRRVARVVNSVRKNILRRYPSL